MPTEDERHDAQAAALEFLAHAALCDRGCGTYALAVRERRRMLEDLDRGKGGRDPACERGIELMRKLEDFPAP